MPQPKIKQQLVFTMKYTVDIEPSMCVDVEGVLEKMQESGGGEIVKVEVYNAPA